MFVGSVPRPVVDQILRTVAFGDWGRVFVCCSGGFRVDRAIKVKWPGVRLISNDVSLYSVSLGRLLISDPFPIRFTERLEFIENAIDPDDFEARVAAVMVAHEMVAYRGNNIWAKTHFRHYVDEFGEYLADAKTKLRSFQQRTVIDGFMAGDFRRQAERVTHKGGGVVAFPPTYRGGYERMHRFVDENTEWDRPAYEVWHCCPVKSRIESIGWGHRGIRLGSRMAGVPVKGAFFRIA